MKVVINVMVYDDTGRERLREFDKVIEPTKVFENEMMTEYDIHLRFALCNIDNIKHTWEVEDDQ